LNRVEEKAALDHIFEIGLLPISNLESINIVKYMNFMLRESFVGNSKL